MTNNLSKELKKYYREIGKFLSCSNKEKKNIIGSIKSSVECYLSENPDSNIDDIIKKLEAGETISEKTIIMDEKGFDATTITQEDVDTYGI